MRTHRLTILAALSAALLVPLLCGYFATFGPACIWLTPINAASASLHVVAIRVDRGGFSIYLEKIAVDPGNRKSTEFRIAPFFRNANPALPQAKAALWGFYGRLSPGSGFAINFPIWCVALPAAVAPFLWFRRRRRRPREPRGFAVEQRPA